MRHYATTAHAAYLSQLRVLHASMRRHCEPFRLHVLAEGREVIEWCRAQRDVETVPLDDGPLWYHPDWAADRLPGPPRNGNELACTWRWRFVADLVAKLGAPVLAVDADVMFWSSPEPVFEEIGAATAAVLPHAFALVSAGLPGVNIGTHREYGLFNGGFVYFAATAPAERMATYCHRWAKGGIFRHANGHRTWGDQGHLELIQLEFGAHVIAHPGAAPGPWCIHTQPLRRTHDGRIFFGGRPLVAYHYSSLRLGQKLADRPYEISPEQVEMLYDPYLRELTNGGQT